MNLTFDHTLTAALGYLLGSIPFGLVLTRLAGLGDIRDVGSGNIGATNVLRTGNKPLALATLLLDGGKGAIAVFIALIWSFDLALIAGLFSVLGHNFPVWLKFKGGKGVATTLGVMLALSWQVGLLSCLTWVVSAALFRYSSLSAIIAFLCAPLYTYYIIDMKAALIVGSLSLLGIARHHQNIGRLIKGVEPRIGRKKDG